MEWVSLVIALVGIALAIYIPLKIEALKRPKLSIQWAADANNSDIFGGPIRIAHIAVINRPIERWLGKRLLRNTANGCEVELTYLSRSDEKGFTAPGKWSAAPEPLQSVLVQQSDGTYAKTDIFDMQKVPATMVYDLSPGRKGAVVAVAMKRDNERHAYAFSWPLYAGLPNRSLGDPSLELPHDTYEVIVKVEAGGIEHSARFLLHNDGDHHTGLKLDRDPL